MPKITFSILKNIDDRRRTVLLVMVGFALVGALALQLSGAQQTDYGSVSDVPLSVDEILRPAPDGLASTEAVIPNDPRYDMPAFRITKVFDLWERSTGDQEVIVAIISSGINAVHPEFKDKLVSPYDFINNNADASPDAAGSGTNYGGVIASVANNSVGMAGICWKCKIMPLDIESESDGVVSAANNEKAFKYAVDKGAKVILIKQAHAKGVTVVTSVPLGNADTATAPSYPGTYIPEVIAVAATNDDGTLYPQSNYGKHVDIAAPGVDVRGPSPESVDGYRLRSGNGVAAGVVTGIAALLHSMYPKATAAQVSQAITSTGDSCCGNKVPGGRVSAIKAADYLEKLYPTQQPTKTGDLNGDGKIAINDLSTLLSRWNSSDTAADFNKDGKVDLTDLSILLTNWSR